MEKTAENTAHFQFYNNVHAQYAVPLFYPSQIHCNDGRWVAHCNWKRSYTIESEMIDLKYWLVLTHNRHHES